MEQLLDIIFEDIFKSSIPSREITTKNTEDWDSIAHLNLVVALEEEFGIDISIDEIPHIYKDYWTVLAFVKEKLDE